MTSQSPKPWAFSEAQLTMIPELRYFVDGQAPMEDLKDYLDSQRGWPLAVTIAVGVLLAPILVLTLHTTFGFSMTVTLAIILATQLFISWLMLGLIAPALQRNQIRAALRARLQTLGIYPCPQCAYDMRESRDQCPECGAKSNDDSRADSHNTPTDH